MNEDIAKKWIIKAENDLKTGRDEQASAKPATDMVCFHMQQCVEKYLKAFLIFHGREITKTHNIPLLIRQCMEIDDGFRQFFGGETENLTDYAVEARYPDDFYMPPAEETERAIEIAETVKRFVREKLKIENIEGE